MRWIAAACLLGALIAAAPAPAAKVTYGSDLSQPANVVRSHPRDWAAWPTRVINNAGTGYVAPVQGEVTQVQLKGTVLKPPNDEQYAGRYPSFGVHVVVLRWQPDGRLKLVVATQELAFPFGGDDQQITTYNLQDYGSRMCVVPGDIVGFSTSGGFGAVAPEYGGFPNNEDFADGYRVQMFARSSSSETGVFEETPPGGDSPTFQVGDTVAYTTAQGEEFLMRTTIGTGADARYTCRTAAEQAQNIPNPNPYALPTATPTVTPLAKPAVLVFRVRGPVLAKNGKVTGLKINGLVKGERVTIDCRTKCGGAKRLASVKVAKTKLQTVRFAKRVKPAARVEIVVSAPGLLSRFQLREARGKLVKIGCGSTTAPAKCP